MTAPQQGFALIETVLALALGLMLLAAAGQVLISGQHTWRLQGASARLQDDAQLVLERMAQDIRMTGMSGCLAADAIDFKDASAVKAFESPLHIAKTADGRLASLSLVIGEPPGLAGPPDWTLLTDCLTWAEVRARKHGGNSQTLAFPIRRHTYRVQGSSLMLSSGGLNAALIDNVRDLRVAHLNTGDGERIDVLLTLEDPEHRIEQRYVLSVALRNRGPEA